MADFAQESERLPFNVAASATAEVQFGGPTAGDVVIAVEAWAAPPRRRAPRAPTGPGSAGGGLMPQNAFTIDVFAPGRSAPTARGPAPLTFTIPPPVNRRPVGAATGVVVSRKWKIRVTNTIARPAHGTVTAIYNGTRPIIQTDVDLGAINRWNADRLAQIGPITFLLENRSDGTYLVPSPLLNVIFPELELDPIQLPATVLDRNVESAPMQFNLIINDNRVAWKTRIDFPYGANLLIENLIEGLIDSALAEFVAKPLLLQLVPPRAKIKTLSVDIMFTMRDMTLSSVEAPPNTCDVLIRPYIELEGVSGTLTTLLAALIEGFASRAYDLKNPLWDRLAKLRTIAEKTRIKLGRDLLDLDEPHIVGQIAPARIRLLHAGDIMQFDPNPE